MTHSMNLTPDSDRHFEATPISLGFDVTVQLKNSVKKYGDEWDIEKCDIEHVWMQIEPPIKRYSWENNRWIDIKKSLPADVLDEIVEIFKVSY